MDRYEDLGLIGHGAMGEVKRVKDRFLGRVVAMKVLRPEAALIPGIRDRFLMEAATTAQLEHPGIIPVYDIGEIEGRPYFTMREIRGRTFSEVIREVHDASGSGRWTNAGGWSFTRLIDAFRQVCEAVAFAHDRGVIHRDLKPENVMIGDFGEVTVMDWGLATTTADNVLVGTPAYMPPEQAWGRAASVRSDVYGLGAVLYEVLSGWPPFNGATAEAILDQVRDTRPSAVDLGELPIPAELAELCERAMAAEPESRFRDAGALTAAMTAFAQGEARREKAMEHVEQAEDMLPRIGDTRGEAQALRNRASQELDTLPSWAPASQKRKAWALMDTARELDQRATLMELDRVQKLRLALQEHPELKEANRALADHYRDLHAKAERGRDHAAALRHEVQLRAHDDGTFTDYLRATGRVSLHTDPNGARVTAHRLMVSDNQLQPGKPISLGRTPLVDRELPMGSYILELNHPGRRMVRYPVLVTRQGRWVARAPRERSDRPAMLPSPRVMGTDEVLIAAGWFVSGGDAKAECTLPRRRVWVDDLIAATFPVTNRQYISWLNELVQSGRGEQAEELAPRQYQRRSRDSNGDLIYNRTPEGMFELDDDVFWKLDWPVVLVSWHAASEYARAAALRDRVGWRLPTELEWEKMARGVDGRAYPWGDALDPSFACVHGSHQERDQLSAVREFPWDVSPYGVRGLGGNAQDWCADLFVQDGSVLEFGRMLSGVDTDSSGPRVVRGGHWQARDVEARSAGRTGLGPHERSEKVGFRLVRSTSKR